MITIRLTLILLVLRTAKSQENDDVSNQASEIGLEYFLNTTMGNAGLNNQASDEVPVSLQTHESPSADIDMQPEQEGSAVKGITVEEDVNSASIPTLEFEDEKGRIWHFRMPNRSICMANFKFMISKEFASAVKYIVAIFQKELEEELREYQTAEFFFDSHTRGFQLIGRAPCYSLNETLSKVFKIFLRKETNALIFDDVIAEMPTQEEIDASRTPLDLAASYLSSIFEVPSQNHYQYPQELDVRKFDKLRSRLFHKLFIESFIAGNITSEEARELFLAISGSFDQVREAYLKPADVIVKRVIDLAVHSHYLYEVNLLSMKETAVQFCFVLGHNPIDLFYTEMLNFVTKYFPIDSIPSDVKFDTYPLTFDLVNLYCFGLQGNHTFQYLNETFNNIFDELMSISHDAYHRKFSEVYPGLEDEMEDILETYWYHIDYGYYDFSFTDIALHEYKILEQSMFHLFLNIMRDDHSTVTIVLSPPTPRGPQSEENDAAGLPTRINDLAKFHNSSELKPVWTPEMKLPFPY